MRRRGLAVLAALGAVAALPGAAHAEDPAVPGYRMAEDAERTEGTESSADGPLLESGGVYTDAVGRGEKLYYRVTLDGRSNAHLSAVAVVPNGAEVAYGDGIEVVLQAPDGTECDSAEAAFGFSDFARPLSAAASRIVERDGDCQPAGSYLLSVERSGEPASTPGDWPLELRFMEEPGVTSGPTEPPAEHSRRTEPPAEPTGAPRDVKGGTGFNDARAIGPGTWKDRLEPGETLYYQVPVDWGRQPAVSAELANAKLKPGTSSVYVGNGLVLRLHNTVRDHVASETAVFNGEQAAAELLAPPTDYANRFTGDSEVEKMSFAGWYYLSVSLSPEAAEYAEGGIAFTLRLAVAGEPAKGPAYNGDAAAAGFAVTGSDREQAEKGQTDGEASRSGALKTAGVAAIGAGAVLVLGLVAWMLVARRRAAGRATPVPRPRPQEAQPPGHWPGTPGQQDVLQPPAGQYGQGQQGGGYGQPPNW